MTRLGRGLICLFVVLAWGVTAQAQGRVEHDVVYGMYSGLALLMDVHHPDRPNGRGIVCIAGSGWTGPLGLDARPLKDSPIIGDWAQRLTEAGYVVFAVNHRSTPRFPYPAAVEDVQRAVRWVRANSKRLGVDRERIGAMGGSSGGHLASMVGVLDGTGMQNDADPVNRFSSKIQAVVALYAAFELKRIKTVRGMEALALFVGPVPNGSADAVENERYAAASPITHVTADDAPHLLFHGDLDDTVPFEQSQLMQTALKRAGVAVDFVPVPRGKHGRNFGFEPGSADLPDYIGKAVSWFDSYLRKEPPPNRRLQPTAPAR